MTAIGISNSGAQERILGASEPPSITTWSRLEPDPRSPAQIAQSLAARIRDPMWLLTRQWQLGEFRGEDAGSPAYTKIAARTSRIDRFRTDGKEAQPLDPGHPLEPLIEREPLVPDLSLRVELGQTLEELLARAGAEPTIDQYRAAYPIPKLPDESKDKESLRFASVCAGRAIDGFAAYQAVKQGKLVAAQPAVATALADFATWVEMVFGPIGEGDAPAWRPERLEYRAEALAAGPSGETAVLAAMPARDGDLDWHAFDLRKKGEPLSGRIEEAKASVQPTHVRFRGMPNHRFWDFEPGTTDFGAGTVLKRDLAKLIVLDFMLVSSNDWFTVPFTQPVGTLCWIDSLVVHDVFGGVTLIERADAEPVVSPLERWTAFSTAIEDDPLRLASFFVVPPNAGNAVQTGPCLEEVRFLRDETAEMAWAIEHTTQNGIGEPWSGNERARAGKIEQKEEEAQEGQPPLKYRIQTTVPENWIPLLPVAVGEAVVLERAAMLREKDVVKPAGRILLPEGIDPYQLREEEVPRTGVQVTRQFCRARWSDGSTHVWIARRKGPGAGEGSSGLRFDVAKPGRSP